jgi:hypothetical protein
MRYLSLFVYCPVRTKASLLLVGLIVIVFNPVQGFFVGAGSQMSTVRRPLDPFRFTLLSRYTTYRLVSVK